jgi:predicted short-subunit dehydrogenase-like oxidoreductase (DUF2520 family)
MASKRVSSEAKSRAERAIRRKATISIIGAGRLGTALGRALASRGYTIEAVVAQHQSHAQRAARLIGARPLIITSAQLDSLPSSDILFITTPDDAIESVSLQLASIMKSRLAKMRGTGKKERHKRTALHASGALSSEVLRSLRAVGFTIGSMHPLVSVSDSVHGAESLHSAFFCIEGEGAAQRIALSIVRALGAKSFSINTRDKALYHAAAVMASGHVTALFDMASEMLTSCGLTKPDARLVLLPLLRSAVGNLHTTDPARALTGTFARADTATVRRHLGALRSPEMRDALAVYTLLGLRSLQLAQAAGASRKALKEIESALAEAARDEHN